MHNLFLDTNIIVDYLGNRAPFDQHANQFFDGLINNKFFGHTSIINLIHTHYQIRKKLSEIDAKFVIDQIVDLLTITDIPKDIAKNAVVNLSVKDFEDAVQYELAISSDLICLSPVT